MFVTVEGIDNAGTTTLTNKLSKYYGDAAIETAEPTTGRFGSILRADRNTPDNPSIHPGLVDLYLFLADRVDHINRVIQPALDRGMTVFCDRYADSTRAYQPQLLSLPVEALPAGVERLFHDEDVAAEFVDNVMRPISLEPDLTLFLDIGYQTAHNRGLTVHDKYESEKIIKPAIENYRELCENNPRIVRIDGEQSEDEVFDEAIDILDLPDPSRI